MKRSKAFKLVVAAILVLGTLLLILAIRWYQNATIKGNAAITMVNAREHLTIGMPLDEADALLEVAWREYHCDYSVFSEHLYLFGEGNPDLSSILFLRFDKTNNGEELTRIASAEPYHVIQFEHCQVTE